jgi:hypothetical protein
MPSLADLFSGKPVTDVGATVYRFVSPAVMHLAVSVDKACSRPWGFGSTVFSCVLVVFGGQQLCLAGSIGFQTGTGSPACVLSWSCATLTD